MESMDFNGAITMILFPWDNDFENNGMIVGGYLGGNSHDNGMMDNRMENFLDLPPKWQYFLEEHDPF